jgi:hypothetical protein
MMGWRKISSYPTERPLVYGEVHGEVLLWNGAYVLYGSWSGSGWVADEGIRFEEQFGGTITHWRPFPAPPATYRVKRFLLSLLGGGP